MSRNLRILHVLRAPVGGLFRHVVDLALEQAKMGHEVGVLYDHSTASPTIEPQLSMLKQHCKLGVRSTRMARLAHLYDLTALRAVAKFARDTNAQILHGHGAKGGAYARFAASRLRAQNVAVLGFYTPHGGSLHYSPDRFSGKIFLGLEKWLARRTNGIIFESAYSAGIYQNVVGVAFCPVKVVPNGLHETEFTPSLPQAHAADFLFVGELRQLKGVDVLLHALKQIHATWPTVRLAIVGDGPDMKSFESLAHQLGLEDSVTFFGRLTAREAFSLGRCIVVPSRAESFPYIVLEAGAASLPLIATDVGGIHEITDGSPVSLIDADNVPALANRMADFLERGDFYQELGMRLSHHIQTRFTVELMSSQITDFYLSILKR